MKRVQKWLASASARLDMPGQIAAGLPKVELTGFSRLTVEQHRGILEYTREAITVGLGIGQLRVTGTRLAITLMNHAYVIVTGSFQNIELRPGGGHE
ncbi:MAG: sporulation protein [Oscillospiraceae bacterium]|nr:sporulation protein [Oscillospiraceae bacterium]